MTSAGVAELRAKLTDALAVEAVPSAQPTKKPKKAGKPAAKPKAPASVKLKRKHGKRTKKPATKTQRMQQLARELGGMIIMERLLKQ
jgi:hypothetical protein